MTPENFCYWLQGYFELYGPKTLDEKETRIIWDHLNLVFNKVTPDRAFVKKPDYYIGDPNNPIPMFDQKNSDGTIKPRLYC